MFLNIFVLIKYIANIVNNFVVRYPVPKNIGYMWNYGSLSGIFFSIQLISGLFLAMFYTPHVDHAFDSVDAIMHNLNYGWFVRLMHLNTASFFFMFIYIHMLRGIYYKSYQFPRSNVWLSGVLIYLIVMGSAFLGYVLPWGQMSYWAATVITNFLTVTPYIGKELVYWVWGGFSINNATLNRFFCLHYLLPLALCVIVFFHLVLLHKAGSSNEVKLKVCTNYNIKFHPFFTVKDLFSVCLYLIFFFIVFFFFSEALNHSINYVKANALVTPSHIVPEWYFLPYYGILRCVLQKEVGIIYMLLSIVLLFFLPKLDLKTRRILVHNSLYKKFFWIFLFNFIFLGYLGSQPITPIMINLSLFCTWFHFFYFLFLLPLITNSDFLITYKNRPNYNYR